MSGTAGAFLLAIAAIAANVPFLTRRLFLVFLVVGGIAVALEARAGQVYRQGWESYAVTFCMFLVLAYPGFVYRCLWKGHR